MSEPNHNQQPNSGQQDKPTDHAPLEDRSEETEATPPQQQATLHTRSTRPARLERRSYTVFTPYPRRGSGTQDWDGDEESIEDLLAGVLAGQPAGIDTFTVLWEEEDDDDEE
jgi:hypothetical protein